ncbi:hypothetical protein HQ531_14005 [bacterium]|nr:hypothetical protein [bacterium]
MHKAYTWLMALMLIITGALADITLSGDARVRPRLDFTDEGEFGNKSSDAYYLYWARLNVHADIGDGYYFKTQLAHNGAGFFVGKFGTGTLPSSVSYSSGGRGTVDFMLVYFGHEGKRFSWSTGLIPVHGDIFLDAQFYPVKPLDIPWILYNNNAAYGADFSYLLGGKKLDLRILVDDNSGKTVEGEIVTSLDTAYTWIIDQDSGVVVRDTSITTFTTDPNQDTRDKYTLNLSYPISIVGIQIKPQMYMTIADEGIAAPLTMGAEFQLPRFAGWGIAASAGVTSQKVETTEFPGAYSGSFYRGKMWGKLGPGAFLTWIDIMQINPDLADMADVKSTSIWLSYKYKIYQSDMGEVSFKPTYRQLIQKIEGQQDLARTFIELTTEFKFR